MFANGNQRARRLGVSTFTVMVLAVGAWTFPSASEQDGALGPAPAVDTETMPAISVMWAASKAREIDDVHANVPLNEIQDGQFCQAYGVVHVGSGPYYFEWSGQFDTGDAHDGPLGENQIVNGFINGFRGETLRVDVWTDEFKSTYIGFGQATLNIDASYEYNELCEA